MSSSKRFFPLSLVFTSLQLHTSTNLISAFCPYVFIKTFIQNMTADLRSGKGSKQHTAGPLYFVPAIKFYSSLILRSLEIIGFPLTAMQDFIY